MSEGATVKLMHVTMSNGSTTHAAITMHGRSSVTAKRCAISNFYGSVDVESIKDDGYEESRGDLELNHCFFGPTRNHADKIYYDPNELNFFTLTLR